MRAVKVRTDRGLETYGLTEGGPELRVGDPVVVAAPLGPKVGVVASPPLEVPVEGLPPVLRPATAEDLQREQEARARQEQAVRSCRLKAERFGVPLKVVGAEALRDGSKLFIFFTAEGRVDFRRLVRSLAGEFRCRIEMRQVGIRNEAKMLGGIGHCGRPLCCAGFLQQFTPITVRMAKTQGLSLDPSKISGICGRLLCCLAFEQGTYEELKEGLPPLGTRLSTPRGPGKVVKHNVFRRTVTVALEGGGEEEFSPEELGWSAGG